MLQARQKAIPQIMSADEFNGWDLSKDKLCLTVCGYPAETDFEGEPAEVDWKKEGYPLVEGTQAVSKIADEIDDARVSHALTY